MGISDRFFNVLKDVVVLSEEVKRLNRGVEKHSAQIENLRDRTIRLETMAEIATQQPKPLPKP